MINSVSAVNGTSNPAFGLKLQMTKSAKKAFTNDKPLLKQVNVDSFESTLKNRIANIEPRNEVLVFDALGGYSQLENMFKLILEGEENTYGYDETASIGKNVNWLVEGSLKDLLGMAGH